MNDRFYNRLVPIAFRREIGQLLIGSLPGLTMTPEIRSLARDFQLGGVTLFSRNIEEPAQIVELGRDLQTLAVELPLWIAVDQEGGRVARLQAPFTEWPPMAALGRSGDVSLAGRFAAALAAELRAVGITLDYAPVLDIHTNPQNAVIGDRALSDNAASVARLGADIIGGLQNNGVAACGKHFPGHGDTIADSHMALPLVEHPPDRIRRVECVPFRAAVAADVAFLMTAHILVPSLDEELPATLSSKIVRGLLRGELGFDGVILSDSLEMKALSDRWSVPDAGVQAIAAGCDGLLICNGDIEMQVATLEALVRAVEDGRIPQKRVDDALARQRRAKERFLTVPAMSSIAPSRGWRSVVGCEEHRVLAEQMGRYL